jgi:8-amino-7-oxononanoate synthase
MSESPRPALPFSGPLEDNLAELEKQDLRRRARGPSRDNVSFADNDYLGLRMDSRLRQAASAATLKFGAGSGSSRLIAGTLELTARLERELAEFKGYEAALVFSTGYQAAVGCLSCLLGPGDELYLDKLCHASLIDGARLSRARLRTYAHGSIEKLRRLLQKPARGRRLIVTDGLFSMDGDLAPLAELGELATRYGAGLMVDEAHASGCLGECGRGSAELLGAEDLVAVSMGTLSKALGSLGGFICASRTVVETLVNGARSFIYTTAPTPGQLAAALAALTVIRSEPQRRARLQQRAVSLRERLFRAGFDVGPGRSHIVPVILGDNASALSAAGYLLENGYHCPAVRYPTVPRGTARLRVSVSSEHSAKQIDGVVGALTAWREDRH